MTSLLPLTCVLIVAGGGQLFAAHFRPQPYPSPRWVRNMDWPVWVYRARLAIRGWQQERREMRDEPPGDVVVEIRPPKP